MDRRIQVVCQVGLTAIGFDEPRLSCDIDLRPTKSLADWLQRRGRCGRAYPNPVGDRDYQTRLILETRAELAAKRNPLMVAPCGAGKSWMMCQIAKLAHQKGKSIGFITVRRALVDDISGRLDLFGVPHGIIMAGRKENSHPTKVASLHTLLARELTLDVSCLFLDEAHCYLSPEFLAVIRRHDTIPRVMMTASPWRADGRGLHHIADSIVMGPTPEALVDGGYLVENRVFSRSIPDLSKVAVNASGEYNEVQLEEVMNRPGIVGDAIKEWLLRAENRPTVAHCVNRKHSEGLAARFQAAGVNAVAIDANTRDADRKWVFDNMCEGAPKKTDALLLDLAGNVAERFGFPTDTREWSLADVDAKKAQPSVMAVRRCPECWFTFSGPRATCPECGYVFVPSVKEIREKKEALVELQKQRKAELKKKFSEDATEEQRFQRWQELYLKGRDRGYKPGWAKIVFYKETGDWPSKAFVRAVL